MIDILYAGATPYRAHKADAGVDLRAQSTYHLDPQSVRKLRLTTRVNIPEGYVGLLMLRSSLGAKGLVGHVGVIDAGYTGPLQLVVTNAAKHTISINVGDRVAQLLVLKLPETLYIGVSDLGVTERGEGGFGSSGVQ